LREPGVFLPSSDAAAGDAWLQALQRHWQPTQQGTAGAEHALLQPVQADAHKAQASEE